MKKQKKYKINFNLYVEEIIGNHIEFSLKINHIPRINDQFSWEFFESKIIANYFKNPYKSKLPDEFVLSKLVEVYNAKFFMERDKRNPCNELEKEIFDLSRIDKNNLINISDWVIVKEVLFRNKEILVELVLDKH